MRSRIAFVSLSLLALALAGCGKSSTSASTPTATTRPAAKGRSRLIPEVLPVKSVTYEVPLSGGPGADLAPAGARNASGIAVISVNAATNELCWKFSQLQNVTAPTVARVYRSEPLSSGRYGFELGHKFTLSGCRPENTIFLGLLGAHPERFYVSIHNAHYPAGIVRAQL